MLIFCKRASVPQRSVTFIPALLMAAGSSGVMQKSPAQLSKPARSHLIITAISYTRPDTTLTDPQLMFNDVSETTGWISGDFREDIHIFWIVNMDDVNSILIEWDTVKYRNRLVLNIMQYWNMTIVFQHIAWVQNLNLNIKTDMQNDSNCSRMQRNANRLIIIFYIF